MAGDLNLEAGMLALFARAAEAMGKAVADGPLARAQEMVPRDTETLADSARVSDAAIEGTTATVTLSYGQPDDANPKTGEPSATYAVTVHERLDVPHRVGQAKWLELAQMEAAATFAAQIAAKME
jgi:hypothetical protein